MDASSTFSLTVRCYSIEGAHHLECRAGFASPADLVLATVLAMAEGTRVHARGLGKRDSRAHGKPAELTCRNAGSNLGRLREPTARIGGDGVDRNYRREDPITCRD
jgi:hypothetical protein